MVASNSGVRVCLLSSTFGDRGAERIMLWLYQKLPRDRYQVSLACLRDQAPFAAYLHASGQAEVTVIGMRHHLDLPAPARLYNYLRHTRPDILHIHSFRAAVWGRPIARLAGVPVILYSVHNKWGGRLHYAFDRWSSHFGDATIPFSLAVKNFLIDEAGIDARKVLPPVYIGIDLDKFAPVPSEQLEQARKKLGIAQGERVIGFVGALTEQKGLKYLIQAVANLNHEIPELKCLVIGEGECEHGLRQMVRQLNLEENILFLGQRYDIPVFMQLMEVFVLPSLWEGLPQVALEAFACRVPVLATAVDGTPEVINHGKNGWLVPPEDSRTLANGLRNLLIDPVLRSQLAKNGFQTVAERFTVQRMIFDFDRLYQDFLQKSKDDLPDKKAIG